MGIARPRHESSGRRVTLLSLTSRRADVDARMAVTAETHSRKSVSGTLTGLAGVARCWRAGRPEMAVDSANEVRILRPVGLSKVCSLRVWFRAPGWTDIENFAIYEEIPKVDPP